jgi:hypothetical protein
MIRRNVAAWTPSPRAISFFDVFAFHREDRPFTAARTFLLKVWLRCANAELGHRVPVHLNDFVDNWVDAYYRTVIGKSSARCPEILINTDHVLGKMNEGWGGDHQGNGLPSIPRVEKSFSMKEMLPSTTVRRFLKSWATPDRLQPLHLAERALDTLSAPRVAHWPQRAHVCVPARGIEAPRWAAGIHRRDRVSSSAPNQLSTGDAEIVIASVSPPPVQSEQNCSDTADRARVHF